MSLFSAGETVCRGCPQVLRPLLTRVLNSEAGYRLARGTFWSLVGAVTSRGLMLAASIFVARLLGKTVYGELGMVRSTVGMFGVFASFGLGLTATKYVAESRRSDPERAARIIGLSGLFAAAAGGVMAVGLFGLAPFLAERTLNAPHLTSVLRLSAPMLLLDSLNGAQTGALSGFEAFKAIARVNLLAGILSFPIIVVAAYYGGLHGAVAALMIGLGINWLLNHLALRRERRRYGVPFLLRDCGRELSTLWAFTLPAALGSILAGPVNWACSALLVNRPGGYAEMGVLGAANQWYAVVLFLPSLSGYVALPILSEQLGRRDTRQSVRTLALAVKINLLWALPFVTIAGLASPYIMGLYGASFRTGWPTLVIVLGTAALHAGQIPVVQMITGSGRMWLALVMNLGWALVFFAGTLLLIDRGSFGLALARAIGYLAHTVWISVFALWLIRQSR